MIPMRTRMHTRIQMYALIERNVRSTDQMLPVFLFFYMSNNNVYMIDIIHHEYFLCYRCFDHACVVYIIDFILFEYFLHF